MEVAVDEPGDSPATGLGGGGSRLDSEVRTVGSSIAEWDAAAILISDSGKFSLRIGFLTRWGMTSVEVAVDEPGNSPATGLGDRLARGC